MPTFSPRSAGRLTGLLLAVIALVPASARADWTTYRGDAARSGVDLSSVGSLPFAAAWSSPNLGGDMYAQPLVHNGLVIVATEGDEVAALSESTGQVVWRASAGIPVPSGQLPCGDISPTVGITSTPVIDPATNHVFVLADNWDGSSILHRLYAFNVTDGSAVPGFPVSAEPPGDLPAAQLQRAALALDGGQIIIGYGGNAGDCSTYHGWLVSVPEAGGAARSFEVDGMAGADEGAIWGSGGGPAVDSGGGVWVSTGNGSSGSTYGYQESVLKLDANMNLLDHWAPFDWQSLDSSDQDIGSSEPLLLPGGLVFEIGKQGFGYLLSAANLGGTGGTPLQKTSVCNGSWGGGIYYNGVIYVTCSTGLRALALNPSAQSFSALSGWQVTSSVNGPPIVSGGLVWATDWNHATLYGLNPQSGQPVVTQSTPSMDHFATPSASDGKLFLATGPTVEAFTIANPAPSVATGSGSTPAPAPVPNASPAKCVLKLRSSRVTVHHPKRRRHQKHAPPAFATVAMMASCNQATQVKLTGVITERLPAKGKHGKATIRRFRLTPVQATLAPGVSRMLQLRLSPFLLSALERRIHESGAFTLTSATAGGTAQVGAQYQLRL